MYLYSGEYLICISTKVMNIAMKKSENSSFSSSSTKYVLYLSTDIEEELIRYYIFQLLRARKLYLWQVCDVCMCVRRDKEIPH